MDFIQIFIQTFTLLISLNTGILIYVLFPILILLGFILGIYYIPRWIKNLIVRKWTQYYPEPSQQLVIWIKVLAVILFVEFMGIFVYFMYIFEKNLLVIQSLINITYIQNLKSFIFSSNPVNTTSIYAGLNSSLPVTNYSNISFENLSGIIGIVTVFIIYLYFYSVFSNTKYFAKGSEVQEKYADIFWTPMWSVLIASFIVFFIDGLLHSTSIIADLILIAFGFFNLGIAIPIPLILRKRFFNNRNNLEDNPLKKFDYSYDFIEKFGRFYQAKDNEETIRIISDLILALTLAFVIFALIYNCNILSLLIVEYCLLCTHFWSSQLNLIPSTKITLILKECDSNGKHLEIKDLFILSDSSNDYLVILDKDSTCIEIMNDSIYQIIYQKD